MEKIEKTIHRRRGDDGEDGEDDAQQHSLDRHGVSGFVPAAVLQGLDRSLQRMVPETSRSCALRIRRVR